MTPSISRGFFCFLAMAFLSLSSFSASAPPSLNKIECPICGMSFLPNAKTSFANSQTKENVHFCSFSCAHKFASRRKADLLKSVDFFTGEFISVHNAYFLIRSKNILKQLDFDMPPSVVSFAEQKKAIEFQKQMGDGEVIHGWKKLENALVP